MRTEAKILLALGIGAASLATLFLAKGVIAKPEEPPWKPVAPEPPVGKRFFKSYEILPNQPQEIWVYVIAAYTCESELRNPITGVGISTMGSGGSVYNPDPTLNRVLFDYLIGKEPLKDIDAMQLAELITLFGFKK